MEWNRRHPDDKVWGPPEGAKGKSEDENDTLETESEKKKNQIHTWESTSEKDRDQGPTTSPAETATARASPPPIPVEAQLTHDKKDQRGDLGAADITEKHANFQSRSRLNLFSVFHGLCHEHLNIPPAFAVPENAVVYKIEGKQTPDGTQKRIPDHAVVKYSENGGVAKCAEHSLSTCPFCAITPSFRFLGPGEQVLWRKTQLQTFLHRTAEPKGFGDGGRETGPSRFQHPDEVAPSCDRLFTPQLDCETLGRYVEQDQTHPPAAADPPSTLERLTCDACHGLTWLVTPRHREGGRSHPSHHASYNERWEPRAVQQMARPSTLAESYMETGTTRSLFVQLGAALLPPGMPVPEAPERPAVRAVLSVYFGAGSRYNRTAAVDLAACREGDRGPVWALPFETLDGHSAILAAALLALQTLRHRVVLDRRVAVDEATPHNSDHSRRKAYRFRAILMTDSAHLVGLFGQHMDRTWRTRFQSIPPSSQVMGSRLAQKPASDPSEESLTEPIQSASKGTGRAAAPRKTDGADNATAEPVDAAPSTGSTKKAKRSKKRKMQKQRARAAAIGRQDGQTAAAKAPEQQHPPWDLFTAARTFYDDLMNRPLPGGRVVCYDPAADRVVANNALVRAIARNLDLLRGYGVRVALYPVSREDVRDAREQARGHPAVRAAQAGEDVGACLDEAGWDWRA